MMKFVIYEKVLVLVLNVICKMAGIAMISIYIVRKQNKTLLPVGAFTFFIPSFGCGGAFLESHCLLLTYSALLLLFLLAQPFCFLYAHEEFTITEDALLVTTAILEIVAAIVSFRLANKLKRPSNEYNNFENANSDIVKILSTVSELGDENV